MSAATTGIGLGRWQHPEVFWTAPDHRAPSAGGLESELARRGISMP